MYKFNLNMKKQLKMVCDVSTEGLIIWQWSPPRHQGQPTSPASSNFMISLLSSSIFNATPFHAFFRENPIPGSGFCEVFS